MNFIKSLVFVSLLSCAFAAVAIGPAETNPDHPNMCFDSTNNQFHAPGETWQLDYCGISSCNFHNISGTPTLMVEFATCGVAIVDPPCYLKEDKTKPYPDCCPRAVCPEDDYNEQENDDIFNEIEDNENGDSLYNHKYNNKLTEDNIVQDPSRLTNEEEENYSINKKVDSFPTNVNRYNYDGNHNYFYEYPAGQNEQPIDRNLDQATIRQRNLEHMEALQEALLNSYPKLRKVSPRFHYIDSPELFKGENFQLY